MKRNKLFLIDKWLDEAIDNLPISKTRKSSAKLFIWILSRDGRKLNQDSYSFTHKPYKYLLKTFSSRYMELISILKENKLIEIDERYSAERHISKKYKIAENPYFPSYSPIMNNYQSTEEYPSCYSMSTHFSQLVDYEELREGKKAVKKLIKMGVNIIEDVEKSLSKLKIDELKLESTLKGYFETIVPASFKTSSEINRKVFKYDDETYLTKEQALEKSRKLGVSIIEDYNGKIYFDNITDFVNKKREAIFSSYLESILGMSNKCFYADRNSTNNRLDSNITNMPSLLLEVIKDDNDLVEIDLCNSQFAIFSHLIPKEVVGEDVDLFKTLSQECELYPYLQEKMALSSRKEAKTVCFEICFSSHRNRSQYVTEMRKLFPTVMKWVDEFKEKYGDNQFAIMLQKKEAEIFIDNLYVMIREEDIFCLTKHDSLIVKSCEEFKVRNIIEEYFEEINFKATIR